MSMMGGSVVGPEQFVQFVVEMTLRGLQAKQAIQGLGVVLVMGGKGLQRQPMGTAPMTSGGWDAHRSYYT